MTDTCRPLATNNPKRSNALVDLTYDRASDAAVATYDDGETIKFADCSRYQYGLCLIVNENPDTKGGFDVAFAVADDRDISLFACIIKSERDGISDDVLNEAYAGITRHLHRSFELIGIPATYRRMDHWILPHLQMLAPAELKALLPNSIGLDLIERFQGSDYAFQESTLLRGRRHNF